MSDIEYLKTEGDKPTLPVGTRFAANADFESDYFKSVYCKDMAYEIRQGNEALALLAAKWLADGKIRLGGAPAPHKADPNAYVAEGDEQADIGEARIAGTGEVSG